MLYDGRMALNFAIKFYPPVADSAYTNEYTNSIRCGQYAHDMCCLPLFIYICLHMGESGKIPWPPCRKDEERRPCEFSGLLKHNCYILMKGQRIFVHCIEALIKIIICRSNKFISRENKSNFVIWSIRSVRLGWKMFAMRPNVRGGRPNCISRTN